MKTKFVILKLIAAFIFALVWEYAIAQDVSDIQKALSLVQKNAAAIGLSKENISDSRVADTYLDPLSGNTLVYLQQTYKGLDVDKIIQVLAFKNGILVSAAGKRIDLSLANSSADAQKNTAATPSVTAESAIQAAAQHLNLSPPSLSQKKATGNEDFSKATDFGDLGIARKNVTSRLLWVPEKSFQRVKLVWEVNLSPKKSSDSWRVMVDAKTGNVIKKENYTVHDNWNSIQKNKDLRTVNYISGTHYRNMTDYKNKFLNNITSVTYRVIPFPAEAPSFPKGNPSLVTDPWKLSPGGSGATPFIWNDDGINQYKSTRGNNVSAQADRDANDIDGRKAMGTVINNRLEFDFMPDFTQSPTILVNQSFAITNLFYWNNIMHDLSYQYGFDEASGNFQRNNVNRGGKGKDFVYADAQDGSGTNNANFSTPPDGENPRMQMYLFDGNPRIDGDLDNGVIAHEYTHGISNRLTGGPSNTACLFNAEQMGEGWSDYIALMTITDWSKAKLGDGALPKGIGTYVLNEPPNGDGVRQYPYSTNMKINPHTYADVVTSGGESHNIGEIWATVLWDMTWNIIQMDGINKDIFNSKGTGGNSVAYKLVMAGMKLQPCSPGFIDGRDAILRADSLLYDGKYSCAIWQAFARRGMGVAASQGSSDFVGDETVDFNLGGIIITKHVNKKMATPGCDLTYTIGLKAKAVCNAYVPQNYSVTDSLPGNARYVSSDGTYHPKNRIVTFDNIDMKNGDSITYTIKVKVDNNASFPDSVYLYDPAVTPKISKLWITKNSKNIAWTTLNLGIFLYYSNDASVKSDEKLITRETYVIPGYKTTFSFFHEFVTDDFDNGGVMEITSNGGKTWEDMGPYMELGSIAYTETITGNSVLKGRKAFSGFGFGYTTIDLSSFAGKKVKIRFRYATSDNSFAVPDGGTGWIMNDIRLSASPAIANTAKLFNGKGELKGLSTITIKIKGKNIQSADFVAVAQNTDALLAWHSPHETNNGIYEVERSTDNGATFKSIGTLNAVSSNEDLQHYTFTDAAPIEGLNFYRIKHVNTKGVVDYSEVKALVFENSKTVTVYPNPAKDKVKVFIPGNSKSVQLQLINALGKQIKNYQMIGQRMELNLPRLSPGVYYLNVIRNGNISKHKIIIE